MIAKDYFRQQATTLRKMVRVTRNRTLANHLTLMANDFENRSGDGTEKVAPSVDAVCGAAGAERKQD
jgi:hypothetical protein